MWTVEMLSGSLIGSSSVEQLVINLLVCSLATWRVCHMIQYEAGPWRVFTRIRGAFGIAHSKIDGTPDSWPQDSVLACIWCFSVWVAIITVVVPIVLLLPLSVSALVIGTHKVLGH